MEFMLELAIIWTGVYIAVIAFVVMYIAYVQNDVLSTEAFYTLMVTAFFLNVAVPVCVSLWKPYCVATADTEPPAK